MPVRTGIVVAGILLLATVPVRPAAACSPARGYKVPTSLELVLAADSVVIAQVAGERVGKDPDDRTVLARPVAWLKPGPVADVIEIPEAVLTSDPEMVVRSDQRELREPNPGTGMGACVRYTFLPRTKLLLFLKRDKTGKTVPYRAAFSRDAEDVDGPDALWVKAVREYILIAARPAAARKRVMQTRIAALRASGDADDAAIARDMAIELSGRRLRLFG